MILLRNVLFSMAFTEWLILKFLVAISASLVICTPPSSLDVVRVLLKFSRNVSSAS